MKQNVDNKQYQQLLTQYNQYLAKILRNSDLDIQYTQVLSQQKKNQKL